MKQLIRVTAKFILVLLFFYGAFFGLFSGERMDYILKQQQYIFDHMTGYYESYEVETRRIKGHAVVSRIEFHAVDWMKTEEQLEKIITELGYQMKEQSKNSREYVKDKQIFWGEKFSITTYKSKEIKYIRISTFVDAFEVEGLSMFIAMFFAIGWFWIDFKDMCNKLEEKQKLERRR